MTKLIHKVFSKIEKTSPVLVNPRLMAQYWVQRTRHGGQVDAPPIFIVGCGHSGTSLALAVLGAHSRIHAIPYESEFACNDQPTLNAGMLRKFDKMAIAAGKKRWVEKTPAHIRRIEKILNSVPDAKVLLMLRDGRDVACSFKKRTGNVEVGATEWVRQNKAGKPFWNHPQVYVLKYEDVVENFVDTVRQVTDFLAEEYEEQMESYYQQPKYFYAGKIEKPADAEGKNHAQHRNWQINQPLFDGRGRWKELSDQEIALVQEIAGDMLAELDYAAEAKEEPVGHQNSVAGTP